MVAVDEECPEVALPRGGDEKAGAVQYSGAIVGAPAVLPLAALGVASYPVQARFREEAARTLDYSRQAGLRSAGLHDQRQR
jgi:hypothetical protein